MTDLKYLILSVLNEDRVPFYQSDLMKRLPQDANVNDVEFALRDLHERGLLTVPPSPALRRYKISPAGIFALEAESERRQNEIKRDAEREQDRADNERRWRVTTRIAAGALFLSFIDLVLAAIALLT